MVYFGGFLSNCDISRGFLYVCFIYIAGRISAAMMAGDIIFFWLAGPVGDWKRAPTVIFRRVFFFILFSRRKNKAAMGDGGGALHF